MKITSIKFIHLHNAGKLKAVFSFNLGGFIHNDFNILQGSNRLYISPCSKKNSKGNFRDLVYPESKALQLEFSRLIFNEYYKDLKSNAHPTRK